jgi:hypothetical protein
VVRWASHPNLDEVHVSWRTTPEQGAQSSVQHAGHLGTRIDFVPGSTNIMLWDPREPPYNEYPPTAKWSATKAKQSIGHLLVLTPRVPYVPKRTTTTLRAPCLEIPHNVYALLTRQLSDAECQIYVAISATWNAERTRLEATIHVSEKVSRYSYDAFVPLAPAPLPGDPAVPVCNRPIVANQVVVTVNDNRLSCGGGRLQVDAPGQVPFKTPSPFRTPDDNSGDSALPPRTTSITGFNDDSVEYEESVPLEMDDAPVQPPPMGTVATVMVTNLTMSTIREHLEKETGTTAYASLSEYGRWCMTVVCPSNILTLSYASPSGVRFGDHSDDV